MLNRNFIPLEELKKKIVIPDEDLFMLSFTTYGGMVGGSHDVTIDFHNNIIMKSDMLSGSGPTIKKEYSLFVEDIEKVKEMIKEYNLPAWSYLPKDKLSFKTDTPSQALVIAYNNCMFRISFDVLMDQEEQKIFNEFKDFVYSLIIEENLIKIEEIDDEE